MLAYLAVRDFDHGPSFRSEDRQPLTRTKLVSFLKATLTAAGIDPTHYSGHSFRIGAATTAAANGISDFTVQTLGRWTNDSYLRYTNATSSPGTAVSELGKVSSTAGSLVLMRQPLSDKITCQHLPNYTVVLS